MPGESAFIMFILLAGFAWLFGQRYVWVLHINETTLKIVVKHNLVFRYWLSILGNETCLYANRFWWPVLSGASEKIVFEGFIDEKMLRIKLRSIDNSFVLVLDA